MVEWNHHKVVGEMTIKFNGTQGRGEYVVIAYRRGWNQSAGNLSCS